MIIDAHNHIGTRLGRKGQTAEEIVTNMDKAGIDKAVVFSYPKYPDNDYIGESIKKFPDRLIGWAVLDHRAPHPEPENEFKRAIFELGITGLKMDTPTHGFSINDLSLVGPTLEICNEYHLPVLCYCADNNFVHPYKFAELAKQYPNVNFIMAHFGILMLTSHCIEVACEYENLYIEISNANAMALTDAINKGAVHKLLFGTDAPYSYFEATKATVDCSVFTEEHRALVRSGNMQRILDQITLPKK